MQKLDQEYVTSLTEELLGKAAEQIEAFKPPSGGLGSWSFKIRHGNEDLYMKVNHEPNTPLGIYFNNRLSQAGLPVPHLIAWKAGVGQHQLSCAIWEFIDGEQANWLKNKTCPYDEAHCGELLRQIHEIHFDGPYCFLGDSNSISEYGPKADSWLEMLPCDQVAKQCIDLGWLDINQSKLLASLPHRLHSELENVPKRLLHMDFMYNGNLIVERGGSRIVGIVDGAEAMAGDPRLELAYFDFGFPGSGWDFNMDAFRSGYGTEHNPSDDLNRYYMIMLLLCGRFSTPEIHVPMAKRNLLLMRTLLSTFA